MKRISVREKKQLWYCRGLIVQTYKLWEFCFFCVVVLTFPVDVQLLAAVIWPKEGDGKYLFMGSLDNITGVLHGKKTCLFNFGRVSSKKQPYPFFELKKVDNHKMPFKCIADPHTTNQIVIKVALCVAYLFCFILNYV